MDNNFMFKIIASLDKALSKKMIKSDLKSFDGQFFVKAIARLDKTLSQRALKQTLKELTNLNVSVNAKLNKSASEAQLRQQLKELQGRIKDLEIRFKTNTGQVNAAVVQAAKTAQSVASQTPIEYSVQIKKDKLINDLSLLAKQNSKLFTNTGATQKYGKLLDDAYGASSSADIKALTLRMSAFRSEIKATSLSGLTLSDTLRKTVGRAGELISATSMVMVAFSQARKAYMEVKALDDQMTSLYKVADEIKSRDDFPSYLEKSIRKARELSVETKSLISSITDWKKIGFGLGVSEELAEVSTKLEKTGDMSIDKATSTLISTLQAFKQIDGLPEEQYADRALAIADKINNISNTRSIDAEGISDALQNSVATLQEANNDINQSIAMIAAGNKIFQSPSEVGNMLKIVSMRLRGVSEDGEQAEESVAKLQDTILNLTDNKVDIMLDDNTFKSTYDILLEISKVYDTLSDKSQALLLEKISGKQRGASTAALLQNMAEAEEIYQDSLNSVGSVDREFERYQESASAAVIRFKETLVETYTDILGGEMIIGIANTGSAVLDLSNKFNLLQSSIIGLVATGATKGIVAISTACISTARQMNILGSAINRVNSLPINMKERRGELKAIGQATIGLSDKQNKLLLSNKALSHSDRIKILAGQGVVRAKREEKLATLGLAQATDAQTGANVKATTSTFSLKTALTGLGATIKSVFMSNPIGFSLMALSVGIGALTGAYRENRQELEESRQKNIEAADSAMAQAKKIEDLYNQYTKLSSITDRTSAQETEFKTVVESITGALGDKAKALEGLTSGTDEYAQALRDATKAELESQLAATIVGRKSAEENLHDESWSGWSNSKIDIPLNINMTGIDEHVNALNIVRETLKAFEQDTSDGIIWKPENHNDMSSVAEYYYALIEARNRLVLQSKELNDDSLLDSDIYTNLDATISKISDSVGVYTQKRYEELKLDYEIHNGIATTVDDFKSMESAIISASGAGQLFQNVLKGLLTKDYSSLAVEASQDNGHESKSNVPNIFTEEQSKQIDNYQKSLSSLSSAIDKVKDKKLSGSELLDLQQEFPTLIGSTDDLDSALADLVDDTLKRATDFLESAGAADGLINTFKQIANEAKGIGATDLVGTYSETIAELQKMGDAFSALSTAYDKFKDKDKEIEFSDLSSISEKFKDVSGIEDYVKAIHDAQGNVEATQNAFDNLTGAYIAQSGILQQVNDGNASLIQTYLEEQGVVNANALVHQSLAAQKEYAAATSKSLADATSEDIISFLNESDAAYETQQAIVSYYLNKEYAAGIMLDTSSDVLQLMNLVDALGGATGALSIYYNALNGTLNAAETSGMGGSDAKYMKQMAQVQANAELEKIKNQMGSKVVAPKFSGGATKPKGGGGEKKKEETKKEFDWLSRMFDQLKEKRDHLMSEADSGYISYLGIDPDELERAKELMSLNNSLKNSMVGADPETLSNLTGEANSNLLELSNIAQRAGMSLSELYGFIFSGADAESKSSYLKQVIDLDKHTLEQYGKAIPEYQKQYEEAASKLSDEMRFKVENGSMDIETLTGDDVENVQDAIDAYDTLQDGLNGQAEAYENLRGSTEAYHENNIKAIDAENDKLQQSIDLINAQMEYMAAAGQVVNASTYERLISQNQQMMNLLDKKIVEKKAELKALADVGLDEGDEDYLELEAEISECEASIWDLRTAQEEYNDKIRQLPIENMEKVINMYDDISNALQDYADVVEASGKKLDAEYYEMQIQNGKEAISQYKEQADLVRDIMGGYEVGSDKYQEMYDKLNEINSSISSIVQNMHEWNKELLSLPINSMNDQLSGLNGMLDALQDVQSDHETVIQAVTDAINEQIEALEEQRDVESEAVQNEIDALQEKLDLLQKQNEARKIQLALEQAKYDLERAQEQKTNQVVREGELVYEADQDAIRDASQTKADAEFDKLVHEMEAQKEALEENLEAIEERYETQIDQLTEMADKWDKIKSDAEATANAGIADEYLGEGWEDKVTSGNDAGIYDAFKNSYETNNQMISKYEQQIQSTEKIYDLLNSYIAAYQAGTISYEQAMASIKSLLSQMNGDMSSNQALQNMLDYLGKVNGTNADADSVLGGIQEQLKADSAEMLKNLEQYNENLDLIADCMTSWEQLTTNIGDIRDLMNDVVDSLDDGFDDLIDALGDYSRDLVNDLDDNDDDDGDHSSGTITVGGGHNTADYGPAFGTDDPSFSYDKGIEKGVIGRSKYPSPTPEEFERLKMMATQTMDRLRNGQVPIIAHEGEVVFNPEQQRMILENMDSLRAQSHMIPTMPVLPVNESHTNNEYNFGNIEVHGVQDADAFARSLKYNASLLIRQTFSKR